MTECPFCKSDTEYQEDCDYVACPNCGLNWELDNDDNLRPIEMTRKELEQGMIDIRKEYHSKSDALTKAYEFSITNSIKKNV